MRFLGRVSYGIFLWQFVVMEIVFRVTGMPYFGGGFMTILVLAVPGTIVFAAATYYLVEWPLSRLDAVLRAILRAGAYELVHRHDVPPRVSISEYTAVAYAFFAGKEPGLANGVLDRLGRTLRAAEM